jgi:hypothetical protein
MSFTPSAIACKIPQNPTTFGPLRLCTEAKIFRSKTVKKATVNKTGINVDKIKINNIN